jgi:1,2-dihydroxy-3-keto-5-methylthiopentene dioxygenase
MALVRVPDEDRTIQGEDEVKAYLLSRGIAYERWHAEAAPPPDAEAETLLAAYADRIDALKAAGGYRTADVIDVKPDTPGLDAMLARFNCEHWHDEDEVRFIVDGRGLFHISQEPPVFAIEVEAGDMIRVPRGTRHWFDLCADRRIRAIRLFQDQSGWTPHYTGSGVDGQFQPLCFGPAYLPATRIDLPR